MDRDRGVVSGIVESSDAVQEVMNRILLPRSFRYVIGGELIPIDNPEDGFPECYGLPNAMLDLGFRHDAQFGPETGYGISIFANTDRQEWWIEFGDACGYCLILAKGWPAFIDALVRYKSLAQLSVIPDFS